MRQLYECLASGSGSTSGRIRFFGLGNQIKGDDSVGLYIVSKLRGKYGSSPSRFVSIESISSSERTFSKIGKSKGNLEEKIIIFDAIESDSAPGSIRFANIKDEKYGFFATHNVPIGLIPSVASKVENIFVLGVQPERIEIGKDLTPTVSNSADKIIDKIGKFIRDLS